MLSSTNNLTSDDCNHKAQHFSCHCHGNLSGFPAVPESGSRHFKPGADNSVGEGQLWYGNCLADSYSVPVNEEAAAQYFKLVDGDDLPDVKF